MTFHSLFNMGIFGFIISLSGLLTILYFIVKVANFVSRLFKESLWSETVNFKKFGSWAVVTGASDGIGKSTSFQLARCGLNLVIISRTKSKLDKFADELRKSFGVEVIVIAVDFTSDKSIYDVISEELKDLDIALLVNNVGVVSSKPIKFLDISDKETYNKNVLGVNLFAAMKMTAIVLPNMVKKGGGIIANISSIVGSANSAYYTMYGASKSASNIYTKSMRDEYKSRGVIFQTIAPGLTITPMSAQLADLKPNFLIPTSELYGKYIVEALGKSSYTNTSFFGHNVFQILLWLIPDFVIVKANGSLATKEKVKS